MAKAVATAASTALPPLRRMSRPTSAAGGDTATTMPCRDLADFSCPSPCKKGSVSSGASSKTKPATYLVQRSLRFVEPADGSIVNVLAVISAAWTQAAWPRPRFPA